MPTTCIYRITHQKYADDPYSGKGGLHAAGRWHHRGQLVVYASESLALATLEQIGRVGALERLKEMVYVPADLDEDAIAEPPLDDLPDGWDHRPPKAASRNYGDRWLKRQASVALCVPSVILPEGNNYVLNPAHSSFETAIRIHEPHALRLDPRITERLTLRR